MRIMQNRKYLFLAYLLIYKPVCISDLPQLAMLDTAWDVLRYLLVAAALFIYFVRYRVVSKWTVVMALFGFWQVITTYMNLGNFGTTLIPMTVIILSVCVITEMAVRTDRAAFLDAYTFSVGLIVVLNFLTVLAFPGGMYNTDLYSENYLLGYDNVMLTTLLPAMCVSVLRDNEKGKRFSLVSLIIFICAAGAIYTTWTATAVVVITVFMFGVLLTCMNIRPRALNIYVFLVIILILFFRVVVFRTEDGLSVWMTNVLDKDITFTGRTLIWDRAISLFLKSPLTGVGQLSSGVSKFYLGVTHAHNYFLDIAVIGGLVSLFFVLTLTVMCAKRLFKSRKTATSFLLSFAMFSILIAFQVEAYRFYNFFLFTLSYHIGYLIPEASESNRKELMLCDTAGRTADRMAPALTENLTDRAGGLHRRASGGAGKCLRPNSKYSE